MAPVLLHRCRVTSLLFLFCLSPANGGFSPVCLSPFLSVCLQEAGRLSPPAGRRRLGPHARARLEVCVHLHPGVLPLPGGERPGQNQEEAIGSACDCLFEHPVHEKIYTLPVKRLATPDCSSSLLLSTL